MSFSGTEVGTDEMVRIVMKYRMLLPFPYSVQTVLRQKQFAADGSGPEQGETAAERMEAERLRKRRWSMLAGILPDITENETVTICIMI